MSREEFIRELEYLLQDIPDGDREDAIAYYRDYLEEAGDDHEADAMREFGSPERVAAIIRADLAGQLEDGGGFTDSGYQDERFRDPRYQVAERLDLPERREADGACGGGEGSRGRRRGFDGVKRLLRVILLLVLLTLLASMAWGIGKSLMGIAVLICILAAGIFLLAGALTAAALVGAMVVLVIGFGTLASELGTGIVWIGSGIVLLGLGLLGIVVSFLVYGRLLPWCIRGFVDTLSRFLHRGRRYTS